MKLKTYSNQTWLLCVICIHTLIHKPMLIMCIVYNAELIYNTFRRLANVVLYCIYICMYNINILL